MILKVCLFSLVPLLVLNSSVWAAPPNYSTQESFTKGKQQTLANVGGCVAYANEFVAYETKSFYVYICGGTNDKPSTYFGVAKNVKEKGYISVPLQSYKWHPQKSLKDENFVAVNANTKYIVTRQFLTVIQNNRTIVKERVTFYQRYSPH